MKVSIVPRAEPRIRVVLEETDPYGGREVSSVLSLAQVNALIDQLSKAVVEAQK